MGVFISELTTMTSMTLPVITSASGMATMDGSQSIPHIYKIKMCRWMIIAH
jgi:hypothetical protein